MFPVPSSIIDLPHTDGLAFAPMLAAHARSLVEIEPTDSPAGGLSPRLVEGLQTYFWFFLSMWRREYPEQLYVLTDENLHQAADRNEEPRQVTVLTSNQEEQLLGDIDSPNSFHRKMTATASCSSSATLRARSFTGWFARERARVITTHAATYRT
ncbi:AXF47915.1 interleukin 6 [Lates japonicus]|uniref:AXF47915.1 interleukin 6 n=1 Tax=Lates japonicus TaxID=270547 RepID=A0AAD3RI69_LATJO|nr:AXF47915.1 interleukin 6 [Lates japonicus]